ncbi:S1/P1 nuclease [Lysobacter antibioticus]|uniref:S1/P1 nuclease n=1 Tax=Lysobacter antibioticus TaxID=84531 RepID=UPI0009E993F7|nr:S1/P1 nuclease [Lysobacter antibioticus]
MTSTRPRSFSKSLRRYSALLLLLPLNSLAWGPQGHRLVAALAWDDLRPDVRAEIAKMLKDETDPSLPGIANWADDLRSNDPELGKRSAKWHYVNLAEDDCRYDAARDCPKGNCAVEAIRAQTAILADRGRSRDERLKALKFVVHFVGDVHQPLHAGFGHDKGGNDYQLQIPGEPEPVDGYGTNLHSLWDSKMLSMRRLDDAAYLKRLRQTPAPAAGALGLPPASPAWAEASCRIVLQPGFYPDGHRLQPAYVETWRPVAETQLRLGGAHLAGVLNAALAHR